MNQYDEQAYFADKDGQAKRQADLELQLEAVALIKQYGFLLPAPAKAFFRKLAVFLKWHDLTKALK